MGFFKRVREAFYGTPDIVHDEERDQVLFDFHQRLEEQLDNGKSVLVADISTDPRCDTLDQTVTR